MPYVKLCTRLGADEIREAMQNKPRRKWHWRKVLVNLLMVAGVLVLLWLAATDLLGPAIDHELDRMPTAESVAVVDEDEPETTTMTATAYKLGVWQRGWPDGLYDAGEAGSRGR